MADHRRRFDRWRNKLPKYTRYLVDQVVARIVPEFEARGFKWYSDFAGGDPTEVAPHEIPLQRRVGQQWPTVQMRFAKRAQPYFSIDFALFPPICRRWGTDEDPWKAIEVPREQAIVEYAPAYFMLCKGKHKNLDGQFGYSWLSLFPRRRLDAEVSEAAALLPVLFDLFEKGIPEVWLTREFGRVDKHVILMGSWHAREKLIARTREG
jgi:hypothetical protein